MKSVWIVTLLAALAAVLQWLLSRDKPLDDWSRKKLDLAIHRARLLEQQAVRLGCREGGTPDE